MPGKRDELQGINRLFSGLQKKSVRILLSAALIGAALTVSPHFVQAAPSSPGSSPTEPAGTNQSSGASFKYVGVNMHSLQSYDSGTLNQVFEYLSQCGVNTVRTFGLSERGGVGSINAVADTAKNYGIQLVVALADFPNGSEQMKATGDPTAWYGGGFRDSGYADYVKAAAGGLSSNVTVVELANEPHCMGRGDCTNPFYSWVAEMASVLAGHGRQVSPGTMLAEGSLSDDPGDKFETLISQPGITMASTHFYPETESGKREKLVQAASIAKSKGKEIMLGEIGFACDSPPCIGSDDTKRAAQITEEMEFFSNAGYDGFLYWQFSGFGGNTLANDPFSWFAAGPEDVDHPICQALRGGGAKGVFIDDSKLNATLMYPKTIPELEKYLANSQVYCAEPKNRVKFSYGFPADYWQKKNDEPTPGGDPFALPLLPCATEHRDVGTDGGSGKTGAQEFVRWNRSAINPPPAAGLIGDGVCDRYEYPIVLTTETIKLFSNQSDQLVFPLFRAENGQLSVEKDLSRVGTNGTLAEYLNRLVKKNYSPQFFITTPRQQCVNTLRYVQYVEQACKQFAEPGVEKCFLDTEFTFQDANKVLHRSSVLKMVKEFQRNGGYDETLCNNISQEMGQGTMRATAVVAIEPATPKLFKLGFYVQHTYAHVPGSLEHAQYLVHQIASWFKKTVFPCKDTDCWDTGTSKPYNPYPGEQLDIVPVWYNAGLSSTHYDQFLQMSADQKQLVKIQLYNFDPTTYNFETEPTLNASAVQGPLSRTYQAFMRPDTQKNIAKEKMTRTLENYNLMKSAEMQMGKAKLDLNTGRTLYAQTEPLVECGLVNGKPQCLCFAKEENDPDKKYDYCPNQTLSSLQKALPPSAQALPKEYFEQLQKLVVARINAGLQQGEPYKPGDYFGPLAVRSFQHCSTQDESYGSQEGAEDITTRAQLQGMQRIKQIVIELRNKLVYDATKKGSNEPYVDAQGQNWGPLSEKTIIVPDGVGQSKEEKWSPKSTRAYLILPDEAMDIEVEQAYIMPMFMSPQMYESIILGKNPARPLAMDNSERARTWWQSPFLTTSGVSYDFKSDHGGYSMIFVRVYEWEADQSAGCKDDNPDTPCECSGVKNRRYRPDLSYWKMKTNIKEAYPGGSGSDAEIWIPTYEYEGQEPTCEKPWETELYVKSSSTVEVKSPNKNEDSNPSTAGGLAAMNEYFRRMVFMPLHMQGQAIYPGLEAFYKRGANIVKSEGAGDPASTKMCKYADARSINPKDYSLNTLEDLRPLVCQATAGKSVPGALVRALLEVEGSPLLRAIRLGGSFDCKANSFGAVGPMGVVVGQCSQEDISKDLNHERNTTTPDLCTPGGALQAGAEIAQIFYDLERKNTTQVGGYDHFERTAMHYLGGGCGEFGNPTDGPAKPRVGDSEDYCAYVARLATEVFKDTYSYTNCR